MVGLYSAPWNDSATLDAESGDLLPSSEGDVAGAEFRTDLRNNPTPALVRMAARGGGSTDDSYQGTEEELLFGGVRPPAPTSDQLAARAAEMEDDAHIKALRADVVARGADTLAAGFVGRNAIGLAAGALDPLNVAAGFIPGAPEARVAAALGDGLFARAAGRFAAGASGGAIGGAAAAPIEYARARAEGDDWTFGSALSSVAFGSVLGGAIHTSLAPLGGAVRNLAMRARAERGAAEDVLRDADALQVGGESGENESGTGSGVNPVLGADGSDGAESASGSAYSPGLEAGGHGPLALPEEGGANFTHFPIRDPDGREIGGITGLLQPGDGDGPPTLQVAASSIDDEADRGKGRGVAAYEQMFREAADRGWNVASDSVVSPEAVRVYDALARRGWDVRRNPTAHPTEDDGSGLMAGDSRPVFTVAAPPEPARGATLEDVLPEARSIVAGDLSAKPPPVPPHLERDPVGESYAATPVAASVDADPALGEAVLRTGVAQTAESRPVEVSPVLDAAAASRRPKRSAERLPESLAQFLAARGGLARDAGGDLAAIGAHDILVPGAGKLVRREGKGLSLDYAREAAEEAGFLPEGSTTADLLDMVAEEAAGRPQYRPGDDETARQVLARREAAAQRPALRRRLRALGEKLGLDDLDHASQMVARGYDGDDAIAHGLESEADRIAAQADALRRAADPSSDPSADATLKDGAEAVREAPAQAGRRGAARVSGLDELNAWRQGARDRGDLNPDDEAELAAMDHEDARDAARGRAIEEASSCLLGIPVATAAAGGAAEALGA